MSRGFLTVAQNSVTGDYMDHAAALALSLRNTQKGPDALSVMIPEGQPIPIGYVGLFDHIIPFSDESTSPDKWNAHTKATAMALSPYDETIMVDADTIFPIDVSWWWDNLDQDIAFATLPKTFRGVDVDETLNPYRAQFRENALPNVYTGLMYWRKAAAAKALADTTDWITKNWAAYREACLEYPVFDYPTDDMSFACAVRDLGLHTEVVAPPWFTFVHMKIKLQGLDNVELFSEEWTKHLSVTLKPGGTLTIGHYVQSYPVHYHDRAFLNPSVRSVLGYSNG